VWRFPVEDNGGAISAERREGGGSCFAFTLPVREEDR
jgi:signal transduction histidine kinase